MRKKWLVTMALGALAALVVAGIATAAGEKPVVVQAGNLKLTFNGGFTPKALSKTKPTPIKLNVSGKIATVDGTHPPALKEFLARNRQERRRQRQGPADLQIQPAAGPRHQARRSDLPLGDHRHRHHRRLDRLPRTGADPGQLQTAGLQRRRKGRRHHLLHPRLPDRPDPGRDRHHGQNQEDPQRPLRHRIDRLGPENRRRRRLGDVLQTWRSYKKGVLTLKCPDGKIQAHGTAVFSDGTRASAEVIRTCTGKG